MNGIDPSESRPPPRPPHPTAPREQPLHSRATPLPIKLTAAAVAGLTLLLLIALGLSRSYPELPATLTLQVDFLAGHRPLPIEPLIVTGTADRADLLEVGYVDSETAVFLYHHAGRREAVSQPVKFAPGKRHQLRVQLPALQRSSDPAPGGRAALRLHFDDREILHAQVPFHACAPDQIYFAQNPLAGASLGTSFRGEIFTATGRGVRGRPDAFFSPAQRFRSWLSFKPHEPVLITLLALLAGLATLVIGRAAPALATRSASRFAFDQPPNPPRPSHRAFFFTAAFCAVVFSLVITRGTFRFFAPEKFSSVYDHQALAFLQGRLDVPEQVLGDEAFLFEGKAYTYFGPTPALLRLPFALFGLGAGQLSRGYMLAYYIAALAAVYALLLHAQSHLTSASARPRAAAVVLLVGNMGVGSTLLFLGSRAYTFHEAILCGVMFSLWSCYCSLRYLADPGSRWWIGGLTFGLLAVHARPPAGLFALTVVGCVAASLAWTNVRTPRRSRRLTNPSSPPPNPAPPHQVRTATTRALFKPLAIGLAAVCGVLSFNALSYLKFKSFEGAPLRYHVQYHPGRLAVTEGRNFHSANLAFNTATYLWSPAVTLRPTWPYVELHRPNPNFYPGARIDVAEPTLPLTFAMPGLMLLALCAIAAAIARPDAAGRPLVLVMLAALPMTAALFTAIAVSHRYTGDFCVPLFVLATWGLPAVTALRAPWRRPVCVVLVMLTATSILTTFAITLA